MAFAIKAAIADPRAELFAFAAQKTMYDGKHIAPGDTAYVFASGKEGVLGLIARGIVTSAEIVALAPGIARRAPRVNVSIRRTDLATRSLIRRDLRRFMDWDDGRPQTELNYKLYRRKARNKVVWIPEQVAAFLDGFF